MSCPVCLTFTHKYLDACPACRSPLESSFNTAIVAWGARDLKKAIDPADEAQRAGESLASWIVRQAELKYSSQTDWERYLSGGRFFATCIPPGFCILVVTSRRDRSPTSRRWRRRQPGNATTRSAGSASAISEARA